MLENRFFFWTIPLHRNVFTNASYHRKMITHLWEIGTWIFHKWFSPVSTFCQLSTRGGLRARQLVCQSALQLKNCLICRNTRQCYPLLPTWGEVLSLPPSHNRCRINSLAGFGPLELMPVRDRWSYPPSNSYTWMPIIFFSFSNDERCAMLCDDCHSSLDFIPSSLYTRLPTILATHYNQLKNLQELLIPATPQRPKLAPWLDLCFRVCVLFSCYSECMQCW